MKKITYTFATLALLTSANLLADTDNDTVKYSTDVPQTISVDSPADPAVSAAGGSSDIIWTVSSNNAFKYSFSSTSKNDDGTDLNYPVFYKQDVDASGNVVPNNYDVLDTNVAVIISDYESVEKANYWNPDYDMAKMTLPTSSPDSPYGTTGRIMPGDDTSEAKILVSMRGTADAYDQSGLYNTELMITVTADEQEVN